MPQPIQLSSPKPIFREATVFNEENLEELVDEHIDDSSKGIVLKNCSITEEYLVFLRMLPRLKSLNLQDCTLTRESTSKRNYSAQFAYAGEKMLTEYRKRQEMSEAIKQLNPSIEPAFDPPLKKDLIVVQWTLDALRNQIEAILRSIGKDSEDFFLICDIKDAFKLYYVKNQGAKLTDTGDFIEPIPLTDANLQMLHRIVLQLSF